MWDLKIHPIGITLETWGGEQHVVNRGRQVDLTIDCWSTGEDIKGAAADVWKQLQLVTESVKAQLIELGVPLDSSE